MDMARMKGAEVTEMAVEACCSNQTDLKRHQFGQIVDSKRWDYRVQRVFWRRSGEKDRDFTDNSRVFEGT